MTEDRPITILTIDDEKTIRNSFRNFLEDLDYSVMEAENGQVGVELFKEMHPDLILVDLRMPEMDGLEVLQEVTTHSPDTPIIVVSGTGVISDAVEALHLGAWDYLLKPVEDLTVLQHAIEKALERNRLIMENRRYQKHLEEEVTRRTEALMESEKRLSLHIQQTPLGVIEWDLDFNVVEWNPACETMFGYSKEEAAGQNGCTLIFPADKREDIQKIWRQIISQQGGNMITEMNITRDGQHIHCEWYNTPLINQEGNIIGVASLVQDITERKAYEARIERDLKEKEVLLKEIHHRVKNNLQVISSLLGLQCRYIQDKHSLELFRESQDRIRSMALVHEKLYQSKDFARIDIAKYIRNLVNGLYRSYHINPKQVQLHVDVENITMSVDLAVPCGLIINELVSNTLKYAFPNKKEQDNTISISLHPASGQEVQLIVQDNGQGIPDSVDFHSTQSLGLHLVRILAEDQLLGTIQLERDQGTRFIINFQAD